MDKRILYILDDPSRDKHVHEYVLEGLREKGYFPIVAYFWQHRDLSSTYTNKGFLTLYLNSSVKNHKGFSPRNLWKLVFLIRSMNIKIVHVQRHRLMVYCALASRITGVPLIYTVRLTSVLRNKKRITAFRFAAKRISKIICVSKDVARSLLEATKLDNLPIEVIYNGIDINQYVLPSVTKTQARKTFNLPKEGFIYGIIARLRKAKDHHTLIRAFSSFTHQDNPDAHLIIVGDGPLEKDLKHLVQQLGINERVRFVGRIEPEKVPMMLKAFDVFVHPSFREGLPMAILEAMSAGLPVIGNKCPPIVEILGANQQFGIVCESKNVPSMEEALRKVYYMDRAELSKIGDIGRRRIVEKFSKESMVEKTTKVYDEISKSIE